MRFVALVKYDYFVYMYCMYCDCLWNCKLRSSKMVQGHTVPYECLWDRKVKKNNNLYFKFS